MSNPILSLRRAITSLALIVDEETIMDLHKKLDIVESECLRRGKEQKVEQRIGDETT